MRSISHLSFHPIFQQVKICFQIFRFKIKEDGSFSHAAKKYGLKINRCGKNSNNLHITTPPLFQSNYGAPLVDGFTTDMWSFGRQRDEIRPRIQRIELFVLPPEIQSYSANFRCQCKCGHKQWPPKTSHAWCSRCNSRKRTHDLCCCICWPAESIRVH